MKVKCVYIFLAFSSFVRLSLESWVCSYPQMRPAEHWCSALHAAPLISWRSWRVVKTWEKDWQAARTLTRSLGNSYGNCGLGQLLSSLAYNLSTIYYLLWNFRWNRFLFDLSAGLPLAHTESLLRWWKESLCQDILLNCHLLYSCNKKQMYSIDMKCLLCCTREVPKFYIWTSSPTPLKVIIRDRAEIKLKMPAKVEVNWGRPVPGVSCYLEMIVIS